MLPMAELGIIEGYFGKPWSWEERGFVMRLLAPKGFSFFIYAPKNDVFLRERWREPHPDAEFAQLDRFAQACRAAGVRFGVGLSPFEAYRSFDEVTRTALRVKLAHLDALLIDDLALLFDDMRGDLPDLAARQVEMAHYAVEHTSASRIILCPTYYSDDPVLDRVFGRRPQRYLESLGAALDPAIQIFWTGEEVCAREQSVSHLRGVADQLRRKPFLWDNYPVNDGARMANHLHLRAFTGRPASIASAIAAHAVNPALQPVLGCIPALTLVECYAAGSDYCYGAAFRRAATEVVGETLAAMLLEDLLLLENAGRRDLGDRRLELRQRYAVVDHSAAREVVSWLDGAPVAGDVVKTG
jgi:hypothetical protein